jgi:hypothetical protein
MINTCVSIALCLTTAVLSWHLRTLIGHWRDTRTVARFRRQLAQVDWNTPARLIPPPGRELTPEEAADLIARWDATMRAQRTERVVPPDSPPVRLDPHGRQPDVSTPYPAIGAEVTSETGMFWRGVRRRVTRLITRKGRDGRSRPHSPSDRKQAPGD